MWEGEREWCVTEMTPLQQVNTMAPSAQKNRAAKINPADCLTSLETVLLWNTTLILQDEPAKYLQKTTNQTCRKRIASEDAVIKHTQSQCGSKPNWWRMPTGIWWEKVLTHAPIMKSTNKVLQGKKNEGSGAGISKTACMWGAHTNSQAVQCAHVWEARKRRYCRCRTKHFVKIKIPGYKPTVPVGRKIGARSRRASQALNECDGKLCRLNRRITHSGSYQWTIDRFNL